MIASINLESSVSVYMQIENHVQFAIASGKLKATDQLPSVRELSETLKVNPNTVAKAYRDLEVMGLLYTRRGMGVFVQKGVDQKCREECRKRIVGRMFEVVAEAKAAGIEGDEIKDIIEKSIAVEGSPYAPTPSSISALAKKKK